MSNFITHVYKVATSDIILISTWPCIKYILGEDTMKQKIKALIATTLAVASLAPIAPVAATPVAETTEIISISPLTQAFTNNHSAWLANGPGPHYSGVILGMGVRVQILSHNGIMARVQVLSGQFTNRIGYITLINLN